MAEEIRDVRYNVVSISSVTAFTNVRGGIYQSCKDVYFMRGLGVSSGLAGEIGHVEHLWAEKGSGRHEVYKRVGSLPKVLLPEEAQFCFGCYQKWEEGGRQKLAGKTVLREEVQELFGRACAKTLEYFTDEGRNTAVNSSMVKNFAVKLIYWFDWLAGGWAEDWDGNSSVKIVAENIVKKQEYFFYYMLTRMGMDVLLLQSRQDIGPDLERLNLSGKFMVGEYGECSLPEFSFCPALFPGGIIGDVQHKQAVEGTVGGASSVSGSTDGKVRVKLPERHRGSENARSGTDLTAAAKDKCSGTSQGPVRVEIPRRPGRSGSAGNSGSAGYPGSAGNSGNTGTPNSPQPPRRVEIPRRSGRAESVRREMSFEELAQLAASVVMITVHHPNGEPAGSGSGIIIGRGGYILTNHHVASHGSFYTVSIEGENTTYKTEEIIKYNSLYDLAIIRIERELKPLPVYKGTPPLVRGQKVVAIGSPLGLFNSVSDGIISGFRTIRDVDMIQFTAPISHGSSGGAVLNMFGEVIGISTAGFDNGQNINLAMGFEAINMFIHGFMS